MGFILVMKAEIVRSWIIMRRYWFRTIIGIIVGYGMLMVLVLGFIYNRDTVQTAIGERLGTATDATNFVLGFIVGMFAFGVVGLFTQGIQSMAGTGVLEQLCMSPHGLITNFLARATVGSFTTIVSSSVLVYLVTASPIGIGGKLYWDSGAVITLLMLTFVNLLGFGFMMGGLVLVFKQIGQVAILLRMALFGVAIVATEERLANMGALRWLFHALPVTDAAICLKNVLILDQGRVIGDYMPIYFHTSFFYLIVNCVAWTTIGMICFRAMENWSRSKGTLGAY